MKMIMKMMSVDLSHLNFLILLLVGLGPSIAHCDLEEMRLAKHIMNDYDPSVRPAVHHSQPLNVNFSLSLHHIIDVDEKNQILTSSCWLTQTWLDSQLTWNESEFGGITIIRLPYAKVWRPDIILYNNADSQYTSSAINTNVIVESSGVVTWLSHGIYKSSCDINVEFFPFDIQNCTLKWASWTYSQLELDLINTNEEGDVTNYHANGEFDLVSLRSKRNSVIYSCCPEPYPDITYTISMKRRPMFYVFNLIIPCLLINGIALFQFLVPCDSGEKVTLGISSLLSMTVFLMTIRESLPPTEKTPLIGIYYGVSICIVTSASALAVFTLNIHHRGFRGVVVPRILAFICFKILSKILLIQTEPKEESPAVPAQEQKDSQLDTFKELKHQLNGLRPAIRLDSRSTSRKYDYTNDVVQRSPRFERNLMTMPSSSALNGNGATGSSVSLEELDQKINRVVSKICETIERSESRHVALAKQEANQLEWKKVALVFDRLLFLAFTLLTAISATLILFSSPYGPTVSMLFEHHE